MIRPYALAAALLVTVAGLGTARAEVINSSYTGWYSKDGAHDDANPNYLAGNLFFPAGFVDPGPPPVPDVDLNIGFHNFFVFDLTGVAPTVTGATLKIFNPDGGYESPDPTETYSLFSVSTPVADLVADSADGPAGVAIYNDLAGGDLFASVTVSPADNGTYLNIVLNPTAIGALNGGSGSLFAFGGALQGNLAGASRILFGGSDGGFDPSRVQLDLVHANPVPEPSGLALGLIGAACFVGVGWRRRLDHNRQA